MRNFAPLTEWNLNYLLNKYAFKFVRVLLVNPNIFQQKKACVAALPSRY